MADEPYGAGESATALGGRPFPTGTVTFLFTDVEGSTRLAQAATDAFSGLLEKHRELIRDACLHGVEFGSAGDALFFSFASAAEAVDAAAATERAVESYAWPEEHRIRVRIGVHTGTIEVLGGDYVGAEVHRVARVCSAAHGGQVLVSHATRVVAGEVGERLQPLGTYHLKDFTEPEQLYQLAVEGVQAEFPPPRTDPALANTLPGEASSFLGREADLLAVRDLLAVHRLVTLTGTGGSGKTRLALRTARHIAPTLGGPAAFVPMAPLSSADQLPAAVSRAFERPPVGDWELIVEMLGHGPGLVVLDNAEHIPGLAALVQELLAGTDQLRVLATSRTPIGIEGERLYPVEPLPDTEAVSLLVERVRQHTPTYDPDGAECAELAVIAERLGGLPLALELAAARFRVLPAAALRERLDRQLDLLTSTQKGRPDRQQTMRGALAWSYDLLDADDQDVFERLSVFAAPATLDAIAAVTGRDDLEALDTVTRLIDASLVRLRDRDGPRYSMLEPVRQYAAELLTANRRQDGARTRLIDWIAKQGASFESPEGEWDGDAAWAFYSTEAENTLQTLSYAAEAGDWSNGTRILFDAANTLSALGLISAAGAWLRRLEAPSDLRFDDAESEAMFRILVAEQAGHLAAGRALYPAAVDAARRSGKVDLISIALRDQSFAALFCGDIAAATEGVKALTEVELGPEGEQFAVPQLNMLISAAAGDAATADSHRSEMMTVARRRGPTLIAEALADSARCYLMTGDWEAGRGTARAAAGYMETHGIDGLETEALVLGCAASLGLDGDDPDGRFVNDLRRASRLRPPSARDAHLGSIVLLYAAAWLLLHGRVSQAATLEGACRAAIEELPLDPDVFVLSPAMRHLSNGRAALGNDQWDALRQEGAQLDIQTATARAEQWLDELPAETGP